MNTPDLVIDPDDDDDDLELYDAPVRPPVKPRFIDVARLANAWCQHYPETARRGNNVEPQNVVEAEDDGQHLAYPHRRHNTNVSTPFSTLYPGTTIQCHFISATNLLEVAMKKSWWNPKTKQDRQDVLMEPQTNWRHEETRPLGAIFPGGFTSGIEGLDVMMTMNDPDMRTSCLTKSQNEDTTRTIGKIPQNEEMLRMMIRTIWSPGLVGIKEVHKDIVH
jgi:hypothetical protein